MQHAAPSVRWVGLTLVLALLSAGCTTHQRVELPPDDLHRQIRSGDLMLVGEQVRIVTMNGRQLEFEVVEVTQEAVRGNSESVLIDDISTLTTERIDAGRTALGMGAGAVGAYIVLAGAAFLVVLFEALDH